MSDYEVSRFREAGNGVHALERLENWMAGIYIRTLARDNKAEITQATTTQCRPNSWHIARLIEAAP